MDERPIGVFDSGIGGLTVFKELKKLMPQEKIVYLGDTGRVPYGTRSREIIEQYARQDIDFLLEKNVKMVIAACGTASAAITTKMSGEFPFLYTGVVIPAAQAASAATRNGKIGVIATATAVRSGAYGRAIREIRPAASVLGRACPLFVPLVENGYIGRDNEVTRLVAKDYLSPLQAEGVDTLIMGCTHFPIIKEIIGDFMGEGVTLIDTGQETARRAFAMLTEADMLSEGPGGAEYYVTDDPEGFNRTAALFLGEEISGSVQKISL